jgi:hypothetical protein
MPELFDVIELMEDMREDALYAGMEGTVVASHPGDAYEVEFIQESGETLALVVLRPHQFIVVWRASMGAPVSVAEQVTALIERLPENEGQAVLDFARFLHERDQRAGRRRVVDSTATA